MNPLTQVKNIQKATARETAAGISEQGSWHERYKDSAYINIGLLPFDLTEGDLLAIFAQYGEVVDVNLVRDKGTGKSRGFAFLAYEDQRSTVLAVDNLNGARVVGRTIRVDHVANYKKKIEEDEEEEQRKREERGVCYAFQRGECNRGAACKFSHDLERNSNSGWGKKEDGPTWGRQRNGQSPPPPPWKQSNGPKDNPPPWRRGSGQRDDPAPSRKENGSNYVSQTRDDNDRQKSDQLAQRHDDLTRDAGPPSSSRQRTSQIDDIPARGGDSSGLGRLSRRYDDSEDDHLLSREGDSTRRDVSPDARRHRNRRDEQYSSYKEREGDVLPRRSARRDDSSLRRRYDTQSEDDSSPKRRHEKRRSNTEDSFSLAQRSGKSRDDSHPTRRHDSRSEDDSSPKRKLAKRSARDDSAFARRGHVQDDTQLSDEDPGAPRNGNTKDWSPRQRSDKYSKDGNFSPKRRYERTEDTERSPRMTHTTSGTSRKGNPK